LGAPARRVRVSIAPAATPDCVATIKSNPIEPAQGRKKEHDSEDDPSIEEKIAAQCQQTNIKKRANFKNPIFVASYLAASGEGKGVGLTICIGDIPLAREKHLPVAVNASMVVGRTTPLHYAHSRGYTNKQSTRRRSLGWNDMAGR
jgi:hypothetical protein